MLTATDGSFVQRYVYDENGTRISAEFDYADGTARGTANAKGEYGENPASDVAVNDIGKVWYRTSLLNSTLFAVDANGAVVAHMIYDPWGNPLTETYIDTNRSGLDNLNNYTGYSWDETLGLYYAQNRFYDAADHRFTQEDIVKDGANWYIYCGNAPTIYVDFYGYWTFAIGVEAAAAFGIRVSAGAQVVIDGEGNVGFLYYACGGGGFPSASLTSTYTFTGAKNISELSKMGLVIGGSVGLLGVELTTNGAYGGITVSAPIAGLSTPLPELHGELTYTGVSYITWKWLGDWLYGNMNNAMHSYYDLLSCWQKSKIEAIAGKIA